MEMGTSKVSVLIGELVSSTGLHIVGIGECQSQGISKGGVTDARKAGAAVHTAIELAEKAAGGVRLESVYLAQTGAHVDGFYNEGECPVSSPDGRASAADARRAEALARSKRLPEGRTLLNELRQPYRVDGRLVPDPEGIAGQKVCVGYWMVHADKARLRDSFGIVQDFGLNVRGVLLSGLASGRMVTTPLERQQGALALDIGAGTTDYVLYRDGAPRVAGVVAVGGNHLTNDLAMGLRLREGDAERLKIRHGRAGKPAADRGERVWVDGSMGIGDRQVPLLAIEQILSARVAELFDVVKRKLGAEFTPEGVPAGVVLTGGASKMEGMAEAAREVFGVPARLGEAPPWVDREELRDPRHSTALGVLDYILLEEAGRKRPAGFAGFLQKIFGGEK
jgi:cell division protein FtsA